MEEFRYFIVIFYILQVFSSSFPVYWEYDQFLKEISSRKKLEYCTSPPGITNELFFLYFVQCRKNLEYRVCYSLYVQLTHFFNKCHYSEHTNLLVELQQVMYLRHDIFWTKKSRSNLTYLTLTRTCCDNYTNGKISLVKRNSLLSNVLNPTTCLRRQLNIIEYNYYIIFKCII